MRTHTWLGVLALTFPGAAAAQVPLVFAVQSANSQCTWTGTSSLGPILGNPSNQFQLTGVMNVDVGTSALPPPLASAAFSGGAVGTNPDIHGRIPNILPFLPPLALIDVTGLVVSPSAPSFALAPDGSFSATVTLTAVAGTLTVTALGQAPTSTSLAGQSSSPSVASGSLTLVPGALRVNLPINTTFPFSDPGTGASGSITLQGTLEARRELVRSFCFGDGSGTVCPCGNNSTVGAQSGCTNSLGSGGRLLASGSALVSADTLVLAASALPATATALFFQADTALASGAGQPFGDGLRCIGTNVIRLGTQTSAGGASSYPAPGDTSIALRGALPATGGTRSYQAWYRNSADFCTPQTFNLTNAVEAVWLP